MQGNIMTIVKINSIFDSRSDQLIETVACENSLALNEECSEKLDIIFKKFEEYEIDRDLTLDYLIAHGLNMSAIWTDHFHCFADFMQQKICKSDENFNFNVLNRKKIDKTLYSECRTDERYVLSKQYEKDAVVESFEITLMGDTILLLDYYSEIWEELFDISPAIALERAIERAIDDIDYIFKEESGTEGYYIQEVIESWLVRSKMNLRCNLLLRYVGPTNDFMNEVERFKEHEES